MVYKKEKELVDDIPIWQGGSSNRKDVKPFAND